MRADAYFVALERLPVRDLDALTRGGLVVVAPHPDDESLGCGGLIAEACTRGRQVRLIVLSDGCGSHPNSPAYPPERLRALRESETLAAVAEFGLMAQHVTFLRLSDAHVPGSGPEANAAADMIAQAVSSCEAGAVAVTWEHDPHCDHSAAAQIVALARLGSSVRHFAYPVWGWTLPPGHDVGVAPIGLRLDVAAHREAKRRAIAVHRSQTTDLIGDDPGGFRLSEAMIDRLSGPFETFIEIRA